MTIVFVLFDELPQKWTIVNLSMSESVNLSIHLLNYHILMFYIASEWNDLDYVQQLTMIDTAEEHNNKNFV